MAKIKPHITESTDKGMTGSELRRLRINAGLSQNQLATRMKMWGWYRAKVVRYEKMSQFSLVENEMQTLLESLGVV